MFRTVLEIVRDARGIMYYLAFIENRIIKNSRWMYFN